MFVVLNITIAIILEGYARAEEQKALSKVCVCVCERERERERERGNERERERDR